MRRTVAAPACVLALALLLCPVTGALCQDDDLGLGDLLGGAGGGQLLGMLGGMGGGGLGAAAGGAKVIVSQPAMVVHGNFLYLATDGKLMKFDLDTLAKLAEVTYGPSTAAAGAVTTQGSSTGPKVIQGATGRPGGAKPPLIPGATPMAAP